MGFKIVIDSCGELTEEMKKDSRFISVPLTLMVNGEEFPDDGTVDQEEWLRRMEQSGECPRSACPSPEKFLNIFLGGEERYYVVTLSGSLSGSCGSAQLGRELALEQDPHLKIHIFDSRSASIGETLAAVHILECEEKGMSFEETVKDTETYIRGRKTFFVLENLDILRKNGRLGQLKAMVASALRIKPVLGATEKGEICQLAQARGVRKALGRMVDFIAEQVKDSEQRILAISHCSCLERARQVREELLKKIRVRDVVLVDTGGVSTMYASRGGIIVAI